MAAALFHVFLKKLNIKKPGWCFAKVMKYLLHVVLRRLGAVKPDPPPVFTSPTVTFGSAEVKWLKGS